MRSSVSKAVASPRRARRTHASSDGIVGSCAARTVSTDIPWSWRIQCGVIRPDAARLPPVGSSEPSAHIPSRASRIDRPGSPTERDRLSSRDAARRPDRSTDDDIEGMVVDALERLPAPFRDQLGSVAIVIEDEATPEQLASVGAYGLYGLYQGDPADALVRRRRADRRARSPSSERPLVRANRTPERLAAAVDRHGLPRDRPPLRHLGRAAPRAQAGRALTVAAGRVSAR